MARIIPDQVKNNLHPSYSPEDIAQWCEFANWVDKFGINLLYTCYLGVSDFHVKFQIPHLSRRSAYHHGLFLDERKGFINEELTELISRAGHPGNPGYLEERLDALVDILYHCLGTIWLVIDKDKDPYGYISSRFTKSFMITAENNHFGDIQYPARRIKEWVRDFNANDYESEDMTLMAFRVAYLVLRYAHFLSFTKDGVFAHAFAMVQHANMQKVRMPSERSEFDIRKPDGWQPPNIAAAIDHNRSLLEDTNAKVIL